MYKILVITDAQNDFTTGVLGNKECEAAVQNVIDVIRSGEYDMAIATQDTHESNYLNTQEGIRLPIPHTMKGYKGWEIVPSVYDAIRSEFGERVIFLTKNTFGSLELASILRRLYENINESEVEIHFVGFCTGICVISNVLIAKAALPEARVCVIKDACACITPKSHETALSAMQTCQVDII